MTLVCKRLLLAATTALVAGASITAAVYWSSRRAHNREGLGAFRLFLEQHHPGKSWEIGPERLDSPALQAAYPGQRFYYVFSSPPPGPGAVNPRLAESHRVAVELFHRTHVSLSARVDEALRVFPLQGPGDYNVGLMPVHGNDDARAAAAAILSLHMISLVKPCAVQMGEVMVEKAKEGAGWSCWMSRKDQFEGRVSFDAAGRCVAVFKAYRGGLPP